ncbi:MAG: hypothetical protein AAGF55_13695 [Pseudomonadota bacterium]
MNFLLMLFGLLGASALVAGSGGDDSESAGAAAPADSGSVADDGGVDAMDNMGGDTGMTDGDMDHGGDGSGADGMDHGGDMDHSGHDHGDGMDHSGHDHGGDMSQTAFVDITTFGVHHGTSSHTHHDSLEGGRTAITTEALDAYNDLRAFLELPPIDDLETIGQWAFDNTLTNNTQPFGEDLKGVGLFYAMQGAKVGWISDDKYDPQILADIQRTARQETEDDVMAMVEAFGHAGFAEYLETEDMVETFVNTLKMEPHYGGWMHGRTHGWLDFDDETGADAAIAHDLNHLTVLSHDQTQPFMNDTFDWPQWPALEIPDQTVIDYFQSMVTLGDPRGDAIPVLAGEETQSSETLMAVLQVEDEAPAMAAEEEPELMLF